SALATVAPQLRDALLELLAEVRGGTGLGLSGRYLLDLVLELLDLLVAPALGLLGVGELEAGQVLVGLAACDECLLGLRVFLQGHVRLALPEIREAEERIDAGGGLELGHGIL